MSRSSIFICIFQCQQQYRQLSLIQHQIQILSFGKGDKVSRSNSHPSPHRLFCPRSPLPQPLFHPRRTPHLRRPPLSTLHTPPTPPHIWLNTPLLHHTPPRHPHHHPPPHYLPPLPLHQHAPLPPLLPPPPLLPRPTPRQTQQILARAPTRWIRQLQTPRSVARTIWRVCTHRTDGAEYCGSGGRGGNYGKSESVHEECVV